MEKESKIFVTGHTGLVGSALLRVLYDQGYKNVIVCTRKEVDLTDPIAVRWFFSVHRPEYVFACAARVGGINANNKFPAEFIGENLRIEDNLLRYAHAYAVQKLLFLGSACIYPRCATNPLKPEYLLTGPLEPTNSSYAMAKLAGIEMCQAYRRQYGDNFISCIPTNLYGPKDHYSLEDSHVIPGMLRRFHEAKESGAHAVTLWGDGSPVREFLYSEDLARALVILMRGYSGAEPVNVGNSSNVFELRHVANFVAQTVGFHGEIRWDTTMPNGTPARYLDNSEILELGWKPEISFTVGLACAYTDFIFRQ
jgi:GDP-L-fucose synthase